MARKIINNLLIKILKWASEDTEKPRRNWKETIRIIEDHIETHSIFLKPASGPQIKYDPNISTNSYPEISGVSVVYYHEKIEVTDTKAPSLYMKRKLENILGEQLVLLLNREPESFSGYYVYID